MSGHLEGGTLDDAKGIREREEERGRERRKEGVGEKERA